MIEHNQNQPEPHQFLCPKCKAELAFAPDRDCLACIACGRIEAIRNSGQKSVGLSVESHLQPKDEVLETPTAMLPFRLSRDGATEKVKAWLANEGLRGDANVKLDEAVYLPFILFRIDANASYTGQRIKYHDEKTELRGLRDEQGYAQEQSYTRKESIAASGHVMRRRMPISIKAFEKQPNAFVDSLVDWDYDELMPFDDAYLAGFNRRMPRLGLNAAYEEATKIATGILEIIAREEIGGNEPKVFNLKPSLSNTTFQPIVIPVYAGSYTFKGKLRHFAVNGHSGEIKGDAPETFVKSMKNWLFYSAVAAGCAVVYTFWMIFNDYDFEQIIGFPLMLGIMGSVFLLFLWLHERIHIWLAALIYVLVSVSIVYLLWFVTESTFIVRGTGMLLGVMSMFILPVLFMKDKDKRAKSFNSSERTRNHHSL